MMTFTFITALFLPGTYVASLFSISMFQWQLSPETDVKTRVSNSFWIYWATTLVHLVQV